MGQSDNPPCPSSALLINYAGPLPISLLVDPSARGARSPSSAATPVWARESRLPLVLGFPRNQLSRRRPTSAFPWPGRDPLALRGLPGGRCAEDHPCLAALGARDQGTVGGSQRWAKGNKGGAMPLPPGRAEQGEIGPRSSAGGGSSGSETLGRRWGNKRKTREGNYLVKVTGWFAGNAWPGCSQQSFPHQNVVLTQRWGRKRRR